MRYINKVFIYSKIASKILKFLFCYKYLLVGCGKLKFTTSYGLNALEPSENIDFTNKKDPREGRFVNGGNDEARLGFAPRSQSFALKPNG